jgi:hypothetical protein
VDRIKVLLLVALSARVLGASPAAAQAEPLVPEARVLSAQLVNAFEECTAPNDMGLAVGRPPRHELACSPTVPSDASCGLSPSGTGSIRVAAARKPSRGDSRTRVSVRVIVKGLVGCDGEELSLFLDGRLSSQVCKAGADCTTIDGGRPVTSCFVVDGVCKREQTLSFDSGANTSITVLGCHLQRESNPGSRTLDCGLAIP